MRIPYITVPALDGSHVVFPVMLVKCIVSIKYIPPKDSDFDARVPPELRGRAIILKSYASESKWLFGSRIYLTGQEEPNFIESILDVNDVLDLIRKSEEENV